MWRWNPNGAIRTPDGSYMGQNSVGGWKRGNGFSKSRERLWGLVDGIRQVLNRW